MPLVIGTTPLPATRENKMNKPHYEEVAEGVFCVDTGLYRHGLAACYLIREGDRLAFADTGTTKSAPGLMWVIEDLGLTPAHVDYVMPTHVHLDHAGGAGRLMALCPNARLVVHPKGAQHMIDPSKLAAGATALYGKESFEQEFESIVPVPEERVTVADDGMVIDLNGRLLTFIDTPGHANHHGCIFDERSGGFFTGDTFGLSYREFDTARGPLMIAPPTPVAFDPDAWQESITKIMRFAPKAIFLTHYCRIDHPQGVEEQLRRSIRDLAEIALAEEHEPEGRVERLRERISIYMIGQVRNHGCDMDDARILDLLGMDIELDAHGLEVWLMRRAKQTAAQPGS
jgi:glyoxylase-like metal-dependent hydrolase (beta-lactamase superfamily II)